MRGPLTPIAVVGMACRLPGGIDSPHKLWESLLRGDDLVTEIPADRWDADEIFDAEKGVAGRSVSKWGAFLEDVTGFDPDFFGINEREATAMDPQHRVLLETAWEAVEHAGRTPSSMSGTATGVFIGMSHDDYAMVTSDAGAFDQAYAFTGNPFSMASGRIAHALGLTGPALTMDTACSSSMVAVHQACRSLHDGESDMALAGGVMLMLDQRLYASASGQGMLSATGHCHAFDVEADGFVRAEGCGIVMLKRLDDAQRDGDRVLAVIRGTASNQDGRTDNILTPSGDAQVAVFRAALESAGIDPATVGMVEGHGTGTPVGDTIEYTSMSTVYGHAGPCALTSVKSNFGHAESAAGVLGLMKSVLSVQHGVVPRNIHFNRLPDHLAKIETGLFVPQENTPWPVDATVAPRRAGVSSYGMSGTNVHVVLEQAPEPAGDGGAGRPSEADELLFPVSSTSADELRHTAGRLADWVGGADADLELGDLAFTLARRRGHRPVRTGVIAADRETLIERLRVVADGDDPFQASVGHDDRGPVFVFSGQGSQWAEMGRELMGSEPVFAAAIAQLEPMIAAESDFSVTEAILAPETVTGIHKIQPAIFAMQIAMAATLKSRGVTPGAVIGHSLGEVAAAVVSGALSLADGVKVICRRSLLCLKIAGGGAMAAVELPAQKVREELESQGIEDVVVAVVTSPTSTVIGGATETVRRVVAGWEQREIMAREVAVDVASHTPQVEPILDELAGMLDDITPLAPEVPYYSATLFDPREQPYCDVDYWIDNLRHTVRFSAAVQTALEDGFRVFAELSPHPLLVRAVDQTAATLDIPVAALAGMRRGQEMPHGLAHSGRLICTPPVPRSTSPRCCPTGQLVDAPLPTWTHRRLILERQSAEAGRGAHVVAAHPLLGSHVRLLEEPQRHVWQAEVGTAALPWLVDHQVNNVPAMPGAAFCEMALAAAQHRCSVTPLRSATCASSACCCWRTRPPSAPRHAPSAEGTCEFLVETDVDGERERRASAVLRGRRHRRATPAPLRHRRADGVASATRRRRRDPALVRHPRACSSVPAFTALTAINATEDGRRHRAGRDRAAVGDPQPAERLRRASGTAGRLLPVGRRPSRCAEQRYRWSAAAARRASAAGLRSGQQGALLPDPGGLAGRLRRRGRHLACSTTTVPCC